MFKFFSGKNDFKSITQKIITIVTRGDSPLEKWLDELKNDNIAELYLYHFIYGWFYAKENKLFELNNDNIHYYIESVHKVIDKFSPGIPKDVFYEIYTDRYKKFAEELSKVRINQFRLPYCPSYFFRRISEFPLTINEFDINEFWGIDHWSDLELADMFVHQINHLQSHLRKTFEN